MCFSAMSARSNQISCRDNSLVFRRPEGRFSHCSPWSQTTRLSLARTGSPRRLRPHGRFPTLGQLAAATVPVIDRLDALAAPPDLIHGHSKEERLFNHRFTTPPDPSRIFRRRREMTKGANSRKKEICSKSWAMKYSLPRNPFAAHDALVSSNHDCHCASNR